MELFSVDKVQYFKYKMELFWGRFQVCIFFTKRLEKTKDTERISVEAMGSNGQKSLIEAGIIFVQSQAILSQAQKSKSSPDRL